MFCILHLLEMVYDHIDIYAKRYIVAMVLPHIATKCVISMVLPHTTPRCVVARVLPHITTRCVVAMVLQHITTRQVVAMVLPYITSISCTDFPQIYQFTSVTTVTRHTYNSSLNSPRYLMLNFVIKITKKCVVAMVSSHINTCIMYK